MKRRNLAVGMALSLDTFANACGEPDNFQEANATIVESSQPDQIIKKAIIPPEEEKYLVDLYFRKSPDSVCHVSLLGTLALDSGETYVFAHDGEPLIEVNNPGPDRVTKWRFHDAPADSGIKVQSNDTGIIGEEITYSDGSRLLSEGVIATISWNEPSANNLQGAVINFETKPASYMEVNPNNTRDLDTSNENIRFVNTYEFFCID